MKKSAGKVGLSYNFSRKLCDSSTAMPVKLLPWNISTWEVGRQSSRLDSTSSFETRKSLVNFDAGLFYLGFGYLSPHETVNEENNKLEFLRYRATNSYQSWTAES